MPAGSLLVYLGGTIHGGGANVSHSLLRTGLAFQYSLAWLRQEENQYLANPPEIARTYPERLQRLIGYDYGGSVSGIHRRRFATTSAAGRTRRTSKPHEPRSRRAGGADETASLGRPRPGAHAADVGTDDSSEPRPAQLAEVRVGQPSGVALGCRTGSKPWCNAATDVGGVITSTVTPAGAWPWLDASRRN